MRVKYLIPDLHGLSLEGQHTIEVKNTPKNRGSYKIWVKRFHFMKLN